MSREGSEDAPGSASLSAAGARTSRKTFFFCECGGGRRKRSQQHSHNTPNARTCDISLNFFSNKDFFQKKNQAYQVLPWYKNQAYQGKIRVLPYRVLIARTHPLLGGRHLGLDVRVLI